METSALKLATRIAKSLKAHRLDFEPHYKRLEQNFLPRNGSFTDDPTSQNRSNRGERINTKMLDSTPMRALRILKSGLQAGITSPSRPWFRLRPQDPALMKSAAVADYFGRAENEMRRLMERSGLYNMLHTGYGHLGVYGTEAGLIEDVGADLHGQQLKPGSYWLGMSDDHKVDTLYREFMMTTNQMVGKFVYADGRNTTPDWNTVPALIKQQYDKGDIGELHPICQLVTPRKDRDAFRMDGRNKPIASQYWVKNDERDYDNRPLALNSGYSTNPISASRWEADGYEVYGVASPAMEALPDVLELMSKRRDYTEMLRRLNRPPMNAHTDLRNNVFSLMPGAINFMADPDKGLRPTFEVDPQLSALREDIEMTKDSVWSTMYADLFMMISQLDRRMITATEIDERREEKLIALGPVLERLHFEKLKPLVERLFFKVVNSGALGPAPEELRGQELEIDFISMLAQAQKAVATGGMERLAGFIGNLAAVKPEVLDKFNEDEAVDEYADMLGTPVKVVRTTDEAMALRQRRQEAEAQAAQIEQGAVMAGAAKDGAQAAQVLSQADQPRGVAPGDVLSKLGLG